MRNQKLIFAFQFADNLILVEVSYFKVCIKNSDLKIKICQFFKLNSYKQQIIKTFKVV